MQEDTTDTAIVDYSSLGLRANPFHPIEVEEGLGLGAGLEIAAAARSAVRAVDAAAGEAAPKPVWVKKAEAIPNYYHIRALAGVLGALGDARKSDLLMVYVPFGTMRMGVVRSTLAPLCDRVSAAFDRMLAAYISSILDTPDTALPEYEALGSEEYAKFAAAFAADPPAELAARFGEPVAERVELPFRGDPRERTLEPEPEEEEGSPEDVDAVESAEEDAQEAPPLDPVVHYVAAYAREHLSPVLGRAVIAYAEKGTSQVRSELRITKAPKKTLGALVKFVTIGLRAVVFLYDQFEQWVNTPDELRAKIVGMISEIRWKVREGGVMVLASTPGVVEELEGLFSVGRSVEWDFRGVPMFEATPDLLDAELIDRWITAATLQGIPPVTLTEGPLADLASMAEGSLTAFVAMAGAAIDDAASRGVDAIDDAAMAVGRGAKG